jgi:hypothetical protein
LLDRGVGKFFVPELEVAGLKEENGI